MSYYRATGYSFKNPSQANLDGGILLASKVAKPVLDRREIEDYSYLENRLFDPQLYLAGLDPSAQTACTKLASYPWFGIEDLKEYDSQQVTQGEWKQNREENIADKWPGTAPSGQSTIRSCVKKCIDYQIDIGVDKIILPAPLTSPSGYSSELEWIDAGIDYIKNEYADLDIPVLATIALQDLCLRYEPPPKNQMIQTIADSVSAREVDGAYVVLEQAGEDQVARHCETEKSLWSILSLIHQLAIDADLEVGVNFLGAFGLACRAAGSEFWGSGWYKSLYRLRLSDFGGGGRAYPKYWSYPAASDIHLRQDFDTLANQNMIGGGPLDDPTPPSQGLLQAASQKQSVSNVADWAYSMSNVSAARDHYHYSVHQQDQNLSGIPRSRKVKEIEDWLSNALKLGSTIANKVSGLDTRISHLQAWRNSFTSYRSQYGV